MAHILATTAKYTSLGSLFASTAWGSAVYYQSSKVDRRKIATVDHISDDLENSDAHSKVNPRRFQHTSDSRSIELHVTPRHTIPLQQAVVWMFNGFFQSWIFAPEALVFRNVWRTTGKVFTKFSGLSEQVTRPIWHSKHLHDATLPPCHTLLFGAFKIMDIWERDPMSDGGSSGVDIAFGTDTGTFSGIHRLSAERTHDGVILTMACMTCNPTEGPSNSFTAKYPVVLKFHEMYSELLFRAGAGNVVRRLEARGVKVSIE